MSSANRPNRKASDADIIQLNSLGLSLKGIGKRLGCHPTTVTNRLSDLGIEPADTRRSFMEDIYGELTDSQREWLANQLGPKISIKDFVQNLIVKNYLDAVHK